MPSSETSLLTASSPPPAVYCPINGRYGFTYNLDESSSTSASAETAASECPAPTSRLSNCPMGNKLTLQFKRCSFQDFEKTFECLGDWQGSDGQKYLALRDTAAIAAHANNDNTTISNSPRFRCAVSTHSIVKHNKIRQN